MKDGVKARYTLEFKREAVRLVHGGEKVSAIARTLGVSGQSVNGGVIPGQRGGATGHVC